MILLLRRRHQTIQGLREKLDCLYRDNNTREFIGKDPVQFPHRYSLAEDIEISAFLAATIAWGRRPMILKSAEKIFAQIGPNPYAYIIEGKYKNLRDKLAKSSRGKSIHRTFFENDLLYFCNGLRACYKKYGSLQALFAGAVDVWEGINIFRETMAKGNGGEYSKHVSNPGADSACKRMHLALRWLVRREGPVDLGLWKSISPASLYIPLDVHVGRIARRLGLLERKTNDKKAVITLTEKLRGFCSEDPVKYDLALFGYSVK